MGNSHSSNDKAIVKSLIGRVGGVPIWPPVKTVNLLDIIVIRKDGSIDVLQNKCKAFNLAGLTNEDRAKIKALQASPTNVNKPSYVIESENASEKKMKTSLHLLAALNVGGKFNYDNDSKVTIKNPVSTSIAGENDFVDVLNLLSETLKDKAKLSSLYRHNKYVYVLTEFTTSEGYKVSSEKNSDVGVNAIVQEQGSETSSENSKKAIFETNDKVIISLKAIRFKVSSDGTLTDPRLISESCNRGDEMKATHEEYEKFAADNEEIVYGTLATGKKMALLIGNNKYSRVEERLHGCHKDVEVFTEYFDGRGIKCDTNFDLTYFEMLTKMDEYVSGDKLSEGDLFIFHYSGHGSTRKASKGKTISIESTICPIDTSHGDGENCDISRDMIQAWMGKLEDKGVKVFVIFDSCHSGGMIRTVDADPEEQRECKGDERDFIVEGETRAELPNYPWLDKVRNNEEIDAALDNVAWLSACKTFQTAKEHRNKNGVIEGGALSLALKCVLDRDEGKNLSFQQIMENVTSYIQNDLKKKDQQPDVSGNVDTVAFCFSNIMRVSPFPYNLATVIEQSDGTSMKLRFMSVPIIPLVTKKSKYVLYGIDDSDMTEKKATIEVESILTDTNIATVTFLDDEYDPIFKNEEYPTCLWRAVEIHHETGDVKHYTKVFVNTANEDVRLKLLKEILSELKSDMYKNRRHYPVKKLPATAFVTVSDDEDDCDVKVDLDGSYISITNEKGSLVLPKVELNPSSHVDLVASYIASYAHWKMLHNLSNPKFGITSDKGLELNGNTVSIKMNGLDDWDRYEREIKPSKVSNEGYEFNVKWDDEEEATEAFKFTFTADLDQTFHVMIVELDLDYAAIERKEDNLRLTRGKHDNTAIKDLVLPVVDIAKNVESGKWCKPFFEFLVFVCAEDLISYTDKDRTPQTFDGMYGVASEGIQEPYYEKSEGEKEDGPRRQARSPKGKKSQWGCIPIKVHVNELNRYSREK